MANQECIGVIGTGLFGTALVERLLDGGYNVHVFNRTCEKAEPLIARGAEWSENPFVDCRRVIFSVYTCEQVASILEAMSTSLVAGQILLDTSTSDPEHTAALGRHLAVRGVDYLETPFSGSSEHTRMRQSTALVAGDHFAFQACDDLWQCLAAKSYYVGSWGNAAKMKLVTNLVLVLNRAVLAEGLVFADLVGLSMERALEVLMNSPAYSRTMDAKGPKMVRGEFSPQARLSQHIKDVRLILGEASRVNTTLPLSKLHLELLEHAERSGLGELDNSAIVRAMVDWSTRTAVPASRSTGSGPSESEFN